MDYEYRCEKTRLEDVFLQIAKGQYEHRRINTVLLHSWYHFTHSMETWVDLFGILPT